MNKKYLLFIPFVIVTIVLGFASCNQNKSAAEALSEEDMAKYGPLTQEAVMYLINEETDEFLAMADENINKSGEQAIKATYQNLKEFGDFIELELAEGFYNNTDTAEDQPILVYQVARFEKDNYIFVISFNNQGEISGVGLYNK